MSLQIKREYFFAPILGFVHKGEQVYILETEDYLFFCDNQKNSISLLLRGNLLDVMGIVYKDDAFQFIDFLKEEETIKNVWIIDCQGKIILKENIIYGYYRISHDCIVVNSTIKPLQECFSRKHTDTFYFSCPRHKYPKPFVIKQGKIIGYYICSLNANIHLITEGQETATQPSPNMLLMQKNGGVIFGPGKTFLVRPHKTGYVFLCIEQYTNYDNDKDKPHLLHLWNSTNNKERVIPIALPSLDNVKEYDGNLICYVEDRNRETERNKFYFCVINTEEEVACSETLDNTHFESVTKTRITIVYVFY